MSVVMSTMAKQQPSATPVFKGLNSICDKLKRSTEDEDDDTADDTADEDDMYRHNGRGSGEVATTSADAGSGLMYDSDDDNSNTEYGLSYSAAFSAANDIVEDVGPVSVTRPSPSTALNESASGGERRNKRKNFKPRNIVYQYESCEGLADDDYSTTSTGDLMTPGRCSGDDTAAASSQRLESEEECRQSVELNDVSRVTSHLEATGTGPMDLSVRSHSPGGDDNMSDNSDDSDSLAMDLTKGSKDANMEGDHSSCSSDAHPNMGPSRGTSPCDDPSQQYASASGLRSEDGQWDGSSVPTSPTVTGPSTGDASTLKDYAESTMKELLGLYGFNDMAAESLTKNVPLDNFSSGKILQTMAPHSSSASSASKRICPTPPVSLASAIQASNNKRTPSPQQQSSQQTLQQMRSQHIPSSENNYDNLCTKVVDSMAKFSRLPPNSIIGNPRVILPPNMTSTILTLAAMQESKFAAAAMAANSTHIQKAPSHQPILPQRKSQPSVIVSSSSSVMPLLPHKEHLNKSGPIDYTRYVKRYSNANECGSNYCKDLNYREHFHCMDCNSRVFVKKEEMIRHFKWHKKRDESLQHGFLRFSPMDDCSERFPNCSHNRKQTHYHCLKEGCDKVYISTSDVQMHANYHRKDSAIIQEGFQRFRATEDCAMPSCSFYGQRTTHFHCRRANCNFTFKNKADMEKHKSYHIKDEQLNKDGFKKFMKHEHCTYENCRYSRVCNHIHCIRAGCTYVLHSSGQLYSHKRKHERRENELAYRKYKLAQSMLKTLGDGQAMALPSQMSEEGNSSESTGSGIHTQGSIPTVHSGSANNNTTAPGASTARGLQSAAGVNLNSQLSLPVLLPGSKAEQLLSSGQLGAEHLAAIDHLTNDLLKPKPDDSWKKYLIRYTANDPCKPNCEFLYKDHYHCTTESCTMMFRSKDGVREHARTHEQQDQVTEAFYTTQEVGQPSSCPSDCPYQNREKHYHCGWDNCNEIILPSDKAFRRLDHYKMHDYSRKLNTGKDPLNMTLATTMDSMFKRKRGRPPKNRVIEVWPQYSMPSSPSELPQAIFTSFKLPKPSPPHVGLGATITGTTSTTQSFMDSTPISAVAMPFGLLPAAVMPSRPGCSSLVGSPTSLPLPLMSQIVANPMQSKAFSNYLQLAPHLAKHADGSHPFSASHGGPSSNDNNSDDDDFDQDNDHVSTPTSADATPMRRSPHTHMNISINESIKNMHPHLFHTPVTESPIYFPPQGSLMSMPGYHTLLSHHPHLAVSRVDDRTSPQQNGSSNNEFDAEHSSQGSPYSNSCIASPTVEDCGEGNPNSPRFMGASRKRTSSSSPRNEDYGGSECKKVRAPSALASLRILKDEPVPQGYIRYRFNEDCRYTHCGYREHQTHFHCVRRDCGYSFCDKTRFVQHTARHERLDTLMGGDFQQFRANVACGRPECLYTVAMATSSGSSTNKASHFHCLKCEYVCTDTNKVVAHRRQHQKLDNIMAAGFEKFTPTQNCNIEGCTHNQKQTHYHCMKCQYAVLGLSQMSAHKYRHLE